MRRQIGMWGLAAALAAFGGSSWAQTNECRINATFTSGTDGFAGDPGWTRDPNEQALRFDEPSGIGEFRIASPSVMFPDGTANITVEFRHRYNTGAGEGGYLAFSNDAGSSWTPIPNSPAWQGDDPNQTVGQASRDGWGGNSVTYQTSKVSLTGVAGQSLLFGWIYATSLSANSGGTWFVDDVKVCGDLPTPTPSATRTSTPTRT